MVVVTWECADHLAALVASMNEWLDADAELIVVDNGSTDDPAGAAQGWRGRGAFERLTENRGFGAAANRGVEIAGGEAVVLLNPDTLLLDSGLPRLAALAVSRRALAAPRLLNPDGSTQPSAGGEPVGAWPWVGALVPGAVQTPSMRRRTEPWRLRATVRVPWASGACLAGPRALLAQLGPFDPSIHMYAEDMELGLRAGTKGIPTWFCPDLCQVVHRRRGSSSRRWREGPEPIAAAGRRAVLARTYGPASERRAWLAERARLRLRLTAKRVLRRRADAERRELAALRSAAVAPDRPRSLRPPA